MSVFFLDTSAVVKLYLSENGSPELLQTVNPNDHLLVILTLTEVEFRAAIRKRQRMGDIDQDYARDSILLFERHIKKNYARVLTNTQVQNTAKTFVDRYILRAYDAMQLAGCIASRHSFYEAPVFVSADSALNRAAIGEGLRIYNPMIDASAVPPTRDQS